MKSVDRTGGTYCKVPLKGTRILDVAERRTNVDGRAW